MFLTWFLDTCCIKLVHIVADRLGSVFPFTLLLQDLCVVGWKCAYTNGSAVLLLLCAFVRRLCSEFVFSESDDKDGDCADEDCSWCVSRAHDDASDVQCVQHGRALCELAGECPRAELQQDLANCSEFSHTRRSVELFCGDQSDIEKK